MLHLTDNSASRRNFLSVGSLALGGLSLPQLLRAKDAVKQAGGVVKDRTVIFLFMHGGPSQTETFDPKMEAPSGIRSMTGEIPTRLPGITFGSTFEKLAKLNDKFSIVRSFTTGSAAHDSKPIVSSYSKNAQIGGHYARVAGGSNPVTGMPRNIWLHPQAVDSKATDPIMKLGKFDVTGPLGPAYAPFQPSGKGDFRSDMRLTVDPSRLGDRRMLLARLDQFRREMESGNATSGLDKFQSQAFETLTGGISDAFDISKENQKVLARYDTSTLMDVEKISKRWNNRLRYQNHVNNLGKLMLMARRLAERGAGFITVTTDFVWDMHADANNATMTEGMGYVGTPFDHAVSAFIEDVEARGLQDKILLVCCGEMGRNPRVNKKSGRDHWGGSAPLMLYGGGLKMGQVVGSSTSDGGEPASDRVSIPNLYATIMDRVLDTGAVRAMAGIPNEVNEVISGASPIRQLI
ncbi:MAG: DUF1501 domain-containing protein [Verrucomicrobiota bacterium]|jgi:hypothetical protein|nr:DUF1501 domain-containing protein [Verrucomicrobiota bacterium]